MDVTDGLISLFSSITDDERKATLVRRMVLNEAYFNLGILQLLETKCISRKTRDRNKLIARLRSGSREAHDLFQVEKGVASRLKERFLHLFEGPGPQHEQDFDGWSDTEIYHYALNKIDLLKTIIDADLESESQLLITKRLTTIRSALLALVRTMKP